MARVLIVDPEPDLRGLAAEAVTELGHEAVVLEEPAGAPAADVLMISPGRDTGAVVARMREACAGLSVILVSVGPPDHEAHGWRPEGYLAKPYTLQALARALDRALAQKEAV